MKYLFFFSFLLLLLSCTEETKLNYEQHKKLYNYAAHSLIENHSNIFSKQDSLVQGVSIYKDELVKYNLDKGIDSLFEVESLPFIALQKDSTIFFYSELTKELKSKQYSLMFLKKESLLPKKLPRDVKVKRINKDGWYEIQNIISLAN